jgi:hypothetical protein
VYFKALLYNMYEESDAGPVNYTLIEGAHTSQEAPCSARFSTVAEGSEAGPICIRDVLHISRSLGSKCRKWQGGEEEMVHTGRFKAPRERGAVKHLLQLPQRNYHHKSIFKLFEIKLNLYLNSPRRNFHYIYPVRL